MTTGTRWVLALALLCATALAAAQPAPAEPAPDPSVSAAPASVPAAPSGASASAPERARPVRPPPEAPPAVEVRVEPNRPSGFWTSTRPARGGAYRYRLLAIGVTIAAIALGFMVWLVRRETRANP